MKEKNDWGKQRKVLCEKRGEKGKWVKERIRD